MVVTRLHRVKLGPVLTPKIKLPHVGELTKRSELIKKIVYRNEVHMYVNKFTLRDVDIGTRQDLYSY